LGRGQPGRAPGLEAADDVGGAVDAELLEGRGGEARGVALGADDDDRHVVGRQREAGVARRVEAPLEDVALDDQRARDVALLGPLRGRTDVDEDAAVVGVPAGGLGREPPEPGAGGVEDLVDAAGPGGPPVVGHGRGVYGSVSVTPRANCSRVYAASVVASVIFPAATRFGNSANVTCAHTRPASSGDRAVGPGVRPVARNTWPCCALIPYAS